MSIHRLNRQIDDWRQRLIEAEADVTLREGQLHDALQQWHEAVRERDRTARHLRHLLAMAGVQEAA
jgi:hypothetical protein